MSTSILSYVDIKEAMDRAMSSAKGIKIKFENKRAASRWVFRANTFRGLDRKENLTLYEPKHTLHGRSPYDVLMLIQRENIVTVLKIRMDHEVEEIQ